MAEIRIPGISRVIGHAGLIIRLKDRSAESVKLNLNSPTRNFQKLMIGRRYDEIPFMASRICGTCGFSHHIASVLAVERALGIPDGLDPARELLNISGILKNHAFHIHWQVLPDYVSQKSLPGILPKAQKVFDRALALQKIAERTIDAVAGRPFHPLGIGIGRSPFLREKDRNSLRQSMLDAIEPAKQAAELMASLDTEFFARKAEYMCVAGEEYPNLQGDIISTAGIEEDALGFLQASEKGQRLVTVGALSRMNNRNEKLSPSARKAVKASRVIFPNYNPLMNNFSQAVEIIHYLETGAKLLDTIGEQEERRPQMLTGTGAAAIESPKGTIIHRYSIEDGKVMDARIMTATALNIPGLEADAVKFAPRFVRFRREEMIMGLGKLIRAYDPCFTCASL